MASGKTAYLVVYNVTQFVGWTYLLLQLGLHVKNRSSYEDLYASVATALQIFQTAAVLEIVHAATGLVRSNVTVTLQQVTSRVYIVWLILHALPTSRNSIGMALLLFAWTITEMIRYSMYAIQLVGTVPYFLTWLRYTFFLIAYPVGVSGEMLCNYQGYLEAKETGVYSISLPNSLNSTFSFPLLILGVALIYVPCFPPMYMHMVAQRKKIIGGGRQKTQ